MGRRNTHTSSTSGETSVVVDIENDFRSKESKTRTTPVPLQTNESLLHNNPGWTSCSKTIKPVQHLKRTSVFYT